MKRKENGSKALFIHGPGGEKQEKGKGKRREENALQQ